jgi:beta-glucosidase
MNCDKEKRLSNTIRAKEIVRKLSLEEKVYLMGGNKSVQELFAGLIAGLEGAHYNDIPYEAGGIDKFNIPSMRFCDGPRGVVCGTGKATCFPVTMARGASFDKKLEKQIGEAMGKEVRAFGGNTFAGVCMNLAYNPGWGRSQETYGEDSFHIGEMAKNLAIGVQSQNVIACIKHFAFNQMEFSRFNVDITCSKRTEREVFLPHFNKLIESGTASVMSSYNKFNGKYCGHHNYLLNQVLKKEWDFDGFIMSDFIWGVKDTVEAANGGQNIEMCSTQFFGDNLIKAVKDNLVSESKIDDAALRIIRTLITFEEEYKKHGEISPSIIGCKEHVELALQSARESLTLIKNDNVLPFSEEKIKKIVVLGELGNTENIGDHGSSQVFPKYVVTPFRGIANIASKAEVIFNNAKDLDHAKELAKNADAVVFVVGCNSSDEGEYVAESSDDSYTKGIGGDRETLEIHDNEIELINTVGPVNKNSCAIIMGGNTILIEKWKASVSSIILAYYPGMEGGTAIGEVLMGKVNPSGKTPFIIPKSEKDLPSVNWHADKQFYEYYHGYAKLEKEKKTYSIPYGFGLSYTSFTYANPSFSIDKKNILISCSVKNVGKVRGSEIVQAYVGFSKSKIDRPLKKLFGFDRISLDPNEEKTVIITCPIKELAYFNEELNEMVVENMDYEVYVGSSCQNKDLEKGIITIGDKR